MIRNEPGGFYNIFQLLGGSVCSLPLAVAFPFHSIHLLTCPFMFSQFLSCPFLSCPSISWSFPFHFLSCHLKWKVPPNPKSILSLCNTLTWPSRKFKKQHQNKKNARFFVVFFEKDGCLQKEKLMGRVLF